MLEPAKVVHWNNPAVELDAGRASLQSSREDSHETLFLIDIPLLCNTGEHAHCHRNPVLPETDNDHQAVAFIP